MSTPHDPSTEQDQPKPVKSNGAPPPDPETETPTPGEVSPSPDPFNPANLRVDSTTEAALGVERPILVVPVKRPGPQDFFRVHPDPTMRLDVFAIELEAEGETYIVQPAIAGILPGETRLVRLLTCITRVGSGVFLWPLKLPSDERRETGWGISARKAAELGETKWVRIKANRAMAAYDVQTSVHPPDPVWPKIDFSDLLRIAFGDGRLIDREDHPVIRQLMGAV